jgi:hypothetical protein
LTNINKKPIQKVSQSVHPTNRHAAKTAHPIETSVLKIAFSLPHSATSAEKYALVVQAISLHTPAVP